jgi:hypothetical protein
MVVKMLLPEFVSPALCESETGFLLEGFNESNEIARWRSGFKKQVQMVGHKTIRSNEECGRGGFGAQEFNSGIREGMGSKERLSLGAASRNEVPRLTVVIDPGKADWFAFERHCYVNLYDI